MADSEFIKDAISHGFTRQQAEWMEENVAEEGHTHEIGDVERLTEALEGDESDETEEDEPE